MNTLIVLGPKIFPPFDSAYSVLGINLAKAFTKLKAFDEIYLLTTYDLDIYVRTYKMFNPKFEYKSILEYLRVLKLLKIKGLFIKHTWCLRDRINLEKMLLKSALRMLDNYNELFIVSLTPLQISPLLRFISNTSKYNIVISLYVFYNYAKNIGNIANMNHDMIFLSSRHLFRTTGIKLIKRYYVGVPVDTRFFRPLSSSQIKYIIEKKVLDHNIRRIMHKLMKMKEKNRSILLYMGPLNSERLPPRFLIGVIKELHMLNLEPYLLIASTIRREDTEKELALLWTYILEKYLISNNIDIILKPLNELEKLLLYNLADVVIYPAKSPWQMSIPPITPLEAFSCGKPVILTRNVPAHDEIVPNSMLELLASAFQPREYAVKIKKALELTARELQSLREHVVRNYALDVVGKRVSYVLNNELPLKLK